MIMSMKVRDHACPFLNFVLNKFLLSVLPKPPSASPADVTPPTRTGAKQEKKRRRKGLRLTRVKNARAKAQAKKADVGGEGKGKKLLTSEHVATGTKRQRDSEEVSDRRRTRRRLDSPANAGHHTPEPPSGDLNVRQLRRRQIKLPSVEPLRKRGAKRARVAADQLEGEDTEPSRKRCKSVEEGAPNDDSPPNPSHAQEPSTSITDPAGKAHAMEDTQLPSPPTDAVTVLADEEGSAEDDKLETGQTELTRAKGKALETEGEDEDEQEASPTVIVAALPGGETTIMWPRWSTEPRYIYDGLREYVLELIQRDGIPPDPAPAPTPFPSRVPTKAPWIGTSGHGQASASHVYAPAPTPWIGANCQASAIHAPSPERFWVNLKFRETEKHYPLMVTPGLMAAVDDCLLEIGRLNSLVRNTFLHPITAKHRADNHDIPRMLQSQTLSSNVRPQPSRPRPQEGNSAFVLQPAIELSGPAVSNSLSGFLQVRQRTPPRRSPSRFTIRSPSSPRSPRRSPPSSPSGPPSPSILGVMDRWEAMMQARKSSGKKGERDQDRR